MKKIFKYEVYITDKHFIEIEAENGHEAEQAIYSLNVDDLRTQSSGYKNVDVDIQLDRVEEPMFEED